MRLTVDDLYPRLVTPLSRFHDVCVIDLQFLARLGSEAVRTVIFFDMFERRYFFFLNESSRFRSATIHPRRSPLREVKFI